MLRRKGAEGEQILLLQFLKFGFVGILNNLIYYVIFMIVILVGKHYLFANFMGFLVSTINAYYWNNKYVFKSISGEKRNIVCSFVKMFISYAGTGLILDSLLLTMWIESLNISEPIAPIINLLLTVPINFTINKLWAFRGKE